MDGVSVDSRPAAGLLRRYDAVPPAHALAAQFEAESRVQTARVLSPIMLATAIFLAVFILTDLALYADVAPRLLALRAAMIALCVATSVVVLRTRGSRYAYPIFAAASALFWLLSSALVATTGDPTGPYPLIYVGGVAMVCMLPWPLTWVAVTMATINGSYLLIVVTQAGPGQVAHALLFLLALASGSVLFSSIHWQLRRMRWESFLNRIQAQHLAERLQVFTDRLQSELEVAREVQRRLLPAPRPSWPTPDVVCYSAPAHEVGGDFYAYHAFPNGHIAIAVGDVSGKGLPAALLMSLSLASFDALLPRELSPGALLHALDRAIEPYTRTTRQNCALCYADLAGWSLRVANAGGLPPLLRRASGETSWVEVGGLPLGVGLGAELGYGEAALTLQPEDVVVFVSDGVLEARSRDGSLLGFERLRDLVAAGPATSAAAMLGHIHGAAAAFTSGASQHDDLTIVVLRMPREAGATA